MDGLEILKVVNRASRSPSRRRRRWTFSYLDGGRRVTRKRRTSYYYYCNNAYIYGEHSIYYVRR